MNLLNNPNLINLLHIVFVGPLLAAIATDRLPQQYKRSLLYLAIFVIVYHLFKIYRRRQINNQNTTESMTTQMDGHTVHYVKMFDSSPGYSTPVLKIKQHDVVVWMNVGETEHTATSVDHQFNSGHLKPGETYAMQFNNPGTYLYYCIPHQGWMLGVVIVE